MSRKRYPPGPSLATEIFTVLRHGAGPLLPMLHEGLRHGDIAHWRLGLKHVYQLNHPALVREFFITHHAKCGRGLIMQQSRGILGDNLLTKPAPQHGWRRHVVQPAFHRERILAYGRVMLDCAHKTMASWGDTPTFNVHEEMQRLSIAIVSGALLGVEVESETGDIRAAADSIFDLFGIFTMPLGKYLLRLPLRSVLRSRKNVARLHAIVHRAIIERRREGRDRGDLLSMLLSADAGAAENEDLTDDQLRDECKGLILAGFETVASALAFTLHLVATHPHVAAKLAAEIDEVLGARALRPEDYDRLPYARMIVSEALRLYPPAPAVSRTVEAPLELAGYAIAPGSVLLVSQYTMHRDARFWPDPLRFDPERFTPAATAERPRFAYFPFGAGPHQCIGEPFAWMESVLVLAAIMQRYTVEALGAREPALRVAVTVRPQHLPVRLQRRR
jgi:cytochrome P450